MLSVCMFESTWTRREFRSESGEYFRRKTQSSLGTRSGSSG